MSGVDYYLKIFTYYRWLSWDINNPCTIT